MNCPHCGSDNYRTKTNSVRHRSREINGATYRCHECQNCRSLFISKQTALDEEAAADLLETL